MSEVAIKLGVELDYSKAEKQLGLLERRLQHVPVKLGLDPRYYQRQLDSLSSQLTLKAKLALDSRDLKRIEKESIINVTAKIDRKQIRNQLREVFSESVFVNVRGSVGSYGGKASDKTAKAVNRLKADNAAGNSRIYSELKNINKSTKDNKPKKQGIIGRLFTGGFEGIGSSLTKNFGKGLSESVEAQLVKNFGSTGSIGKVIGKTILQGVGERFKSIDKAITDSIEQGLKTAQGKEKKDLRKFRDSYSAFKQIQLLDSATIQSDVAIAEERKFTESQARKRSVRAGGLQRFRQLNRISDVANILGQTPEDKPLDPRYAASLKGEDRGRAMQLGEGLREKKRLDKIVEDLDAKTKDVNSLLDKFSSLFLSAAETGDAQQMAQIEQQITKLNKDLLELKKVRLKVDKKTQTNRDLLQGFKEEIQGAYNQAYENIDGMNRRYLRMLQEAMGDAFDIDTIPELVADPTLLKTGKKGAYNLAANQLKITPGMANRMMQNRMTSEDEATLRHEIQHFVDFEGGSFEGRLRQHSGAIDLSSVTAKENKDLERFVESYRRAGYSEEDIRFEVSAEVQSRRFMKNREKELNAIAIREMDVQGMVPVDVIDKIYSDIEDLKNIASSYDIDTQEIDDFVESVKQIVKRTNDLVGIAKESAVVDSKYSATTIQKGMEGNLMNIAKKKLQARQLQRDFLTQIKAKQRPKINLQGEGEKREKIAIAIPGQPIPQPGKQLILPRQPLAQESLEEPQAESLEKLPYMIEMIQKGIDSLGELEIDPDRINRFMKLTSVFKNVSTEGLPIEELVKFNKQLIKLKKILKESVQETQEQVKNQEKLFNQIGNIADALDQTEIADEGFTLGVSEAKRSVPRLEEIGGRPPLPLPPIPDRFKLRSPLPLPPIPDRFKLRSPLPLPPIPDRFKLRSPLPLPPIPDKFKLKGSSEQWFDEEQLNRLIKKSFTERIKAAFSKILGRVDANSIQDQELRVSDAYNKALSTINERFEPTTNKEEQEVILKSARENILRYLTVVEQAKDKLDDSYADLLDQAVDYQDILEVLGEEYTESSADVAQQLLDDIQGKAESLEQAVDYADQVMAAEDMGLTRQEALGMQDEDGDIIESLKGRMEGFFDNIKQNIPFLREFQLGMKGVFLAFLSFKGIQQVIGLMREGFELALQRRRDLTTLSVIGFYDATSKIKELRQELNQLGIDIQKAAQNYSSFASGLRYTELASDTDQIFGGVSIASAALNIRSEAFDRVMVAMQQMAAKSVVSMEELRQQLGESLPGAFSLAARAMGMTEKQFNKLVSTGQVMAVDLLPKLATSLEETFAPNLTEATKAFPAQMQMFANSLNEVKTSFGEVAILAGELVLPTINKGFAALGENASIIPGVIGGVTLSFTSMAIAAVKSSTTGAIALKGLGTAAKAAGAQLFSLSTAKYLATGLGIGAASFIAVEAFQYMRNIGSQEMESLAKTVGNRVDYIKKRLGELGESETLIDTRTWQDRSVDFLVDQLNRRNPVETNRILDSQEAKAFKASESRQKALNALTQEAVLLTRNLYDPTRVDTFAKKQKDLTQEIDNQRATLRIIESQGDLSGQDPRIQELSKRFQGDTDLAIKDVNKRLKELGQELKGLETAFSPGGLNSIQRAIDDYKIILEEAKKSQDTLVEQEAISQIAKLEEAYAKLAKVIDKDLVNALKVFRDLNADIANQRQELELSEARRSTDLARVSRSELDDPISQQRNQLETARAQLAAGRKRVQQQFDAINQTITGARRRELLNALGVSSLRDARTGDVQRAREILGESDQLTPDLEKALEALEQINQTMVENAQVETQVVQSSKELAKQLRELPVNKLRMAIETIATQTAIASNTSTTRILGLEATGQISGARSDYLVDEAQRNARIKGAKEEIKTLSELRSVLSNNASQRIKAAKQALSQQKITQEEYENIVLEVNRTILNSDQELSDARLRLAQEELAKRQAYIQETLRLQKKLRDEQIHQLTRGRTRKLIEAELEKQLDLQEDSNVTRLEAELDYNDQLKQIKELELRQLDELNKGNVAKDRNYLETRRSLVEEIDNLELQTLTQRGELIQAQNDLEIKGLEREIDYRTKLSEILRDEQEQRKSILESTRELVSSLSGLATGRLQGMSSIFGKLTELFRGEGKEDKAIEEYQKKQAKIARDRFSSLVGGGFQGGSVNDRLSILKRQEKIEKQLANEKLIALQQEQQLAREILLIEQEQSREAQKQAVQQAKIAQLRAEQKVAIADQKLLEATTPREQQIAQKGREIALREIDLANQQLQSAQNAIATEQRLQDIRRSSLQNQQTEALRGLALDSVLNNPGALRGINPLTIAAPRAMSRQPLSIASPMATSLDELNELYGGRSSLADLNNRFAPAANSLEGLNERYAPNAVNSSNLESTIKRSLENNPTTNVGGITINNYIESNGDPEEISDKIVEKSLKRFSEALPSF